MSKSEFAVRIENISLHNFKNIGNGSVYFNEYKRLERKDILNDNYSNVLGIYGQNASGKTSIIDALKILRHILSCGSLNSVVQNYVKKGSDGFTLSISFLLTNNIKSILLNYELGLKIDEKSIYINNESLTSMDSNEDHSKLGDKKVLFAYSKKNGIKDSFLSLIETKEKKTIINYLSVQKTIAYFDNSNSFLTSALFNAETLNIVNNESKLKELNVILTSILDFSMNKFLIVTTNMYESIDARGIGVNGFDFEGNQDTVHKNYSILFGRQILEEDKYNDFLKMLDASGKVLNTLIPGLSIKSHEYEETIGSNGKRAIVFEVMSIRDDKEIPLFYESRGVKQMLTYVGDLIGVFNEEGTFIAIDELDSGVFEYLLGEIIYSFDNFSLGQLLFTSHNFRILEKIKSNEIFFTTANDGNKFVQPKYIKNNNNLRDVYYRLIVQGDDKEKYYNKTSSVEISKIFSSLGKENRWEDVY